MMRHAWMMVLGLGLAACDQAQEDRAAERAAEAVHKGNQALRTLSEKAREGTAKAGETAREGARELGGTLSDATITARVKAALLAEQAVDGSRVRVETHGGVVTLSGSLSDLKEVERAIEIAQSTEGVKSVQSKFSPAG